LRSSAVIFHHGTIFLAAGWLVDVNNIPPVGRENEGEQERRISGAFHTLAATTTLGQFISRGC